MSKKRRIFDIDLPEEGETFPAGKPEAAAGPAPRRSPMAAAISENAASLRDRAQIEAQIRAENDALAAEHVRMKKLGLIVDLVPLERIDAEKLTRDRAAGADEDLAELVASIRDIGLSNPIRLEMREDGRYELIQGYRRLAAYRQLLQMTGDTDRWGTIPAGILPRGEGIDQLYRRMVDENLVRKDISFGEMAALALAYARDPETEQSDPDKAVAELFASAGYQKRSYIRSFIKLLDRLGRDLKFVQNVPRALGLKLVAVLEERPEVAEQLQAALKGWTSRTAEEELELLRRAAGAEPPAAVKPTATAPVARPGKAKTVFQVPSTLGQAKCTAANGRLEIRLDRDFSALDRRRLEQALQRMLDGLED
ncbi:ParB/RepB/Spo0J family partition protein [Pseudodonghicola flavimaris]|uniref:ParB N-terminal domain-containing protein n=1 Tax=Pseudodonghicola flavimaris TaxID=3050036 RepID=A0ABT7F887_9RHOB|nr:ParB N-terminal domain-containing protein [Pseudodonghicola flavimaris]MDK3020833.1 ParB N-terminal domain-containing protein [Pseudodonghicola flavimaris]